MMGNSPPPPPPPPHIIVQCVHALDYTCNGTIKSLVFVVMNFTFMIVLARQKINGYHIIIHTYVIIIIADYFIMS